MPKQPAIPADIAALGYEQARDELVALVARLEGGRVPLEESMALWERGEALAAHAQNWLDRAQARLDGEPEPAPSRPATSAQSSADDEDIADEDLDDEDDAPSETDADAPAALDDYMDDDLDDEDSEETDSGDADLAADEA